MYPYCSDDSKLTSNLFFNNDCNDRVLNCRICRVYALNLLSVQSKYAFCFLHQQVGDSETFMATYGSNWLVTCLLLTVNIICNNFAIHSSIIVVLLSCYILLDIFVLDRNKYEALGNQTWVSSIISCPPISQNKPTRKYSHITLFFLSIGGNF